MRRASGPAPVITEPAKLGAVTDQYIALATARANEAIDVTPRISSVVSAIRFEEGQSVDAGVVLVELDSREIRAELDLAEANLRERRSRYGRLEALAASQVVSEVELEEIQAQLQVAEAQVNSAPRPDGGHCDPRAVLRDGGPAAGQRGRAGAAQHGHYHPGRHRRDEA